MKSVILLAFVLLLAPFVASAGDVEDVEAAYRTYIKTLKKGDAEAVVALLGDNFVRATSATPVAVKTDREQWTKDFATYFKGMERLSVMTIDPKVYVVNNTGMVYGHRNVRGTWEDRKVKYDERFFVTFSRENGKWLVVAETAEPITLGANKSKY